MTKQQFNPLLFFKLAICFFGTHLLALIAIRYLVADPSIAQQVAPILGQATTVWDAFSWKAFIIWFLFAFLIFYILLRLQRVGPIIYKVILTFILIGGIQTILLLFKIPFSFIFAILAVILFWQRHTVLTHNVIVAMAIAGIGIVIGISFQPLAVVALLIVFSFYDIVAVYSTKHMVKMAEMMIRARAIFGFIIPSQASVLRTKLASLKPGSDAMILGSGDVLLPLILIVSLALSSFRDGFIVSIFSLFGLFVMQYLFEHQRVRRAMAALPPIALFAILGYLFVLIF